MALCFRVAELGVRRRAAIEGLYSWGRERECEGEPRARVRARVAVGREEEEGMPLAEWRRARWLAGGAAVRVG